MVVVSAAQLCGARVVWVAVAVAGAVAVAAVAVAVAVAAAAAAAAVAVAEVVAVARTRPPGEARDLLLPATYAVVIFSIVVQGLTVQRLARMAWSGP